ncbi:MAG: thioredoxin family protein [Alcanivorax sp.]
MVKKLTYGLLALAFVPLALGWASVPVKAAVEIGKPAPNFTATDIDGNEFSLEDQKGKIVVLEWTNNGCPFVRKHYDTKNMQNTQKTATDNGVVWVSIVSSAPGKQGYMTPEEAQKLVKDEGAHATTRILDTTGEIGKMYAAKTTPHMFVISAQGNVEYAGAIDDNPSPNPKAVEGAENLVLAALDALSTGKSVEVPLTQPYGCSVKY